MSQLRLRHFEWFSCLAEKRGMQVTQAVPTHSRDGCSTTRRVDNPPKQVVSAQRRPPPRWEKQIVGAALSDALRMCEQGSQHDVSQWKVTNAAPSFRWAKLPPVNTLAHLEDATLKVDVTPPQCKQLARPDPGESTEQNHRTHRFRQYPEKRAELLDCDHSGRTLKLLGWEPYPSGWIGIEVVPLNRCPENTARQVAKILHRVPRFTGLSLLHHEGLYIGGPDVAQTPITKIREQMRSEEHTSELQS